MLISDKHQFIFIHIYKNAGTSIKFALRLNAFDKCSYFVDRALQRKDIKRPILGYHNYKGHPTAIDIIDQLGSSKFNSYFSFAIVRNPWDWQVSLYNYMLKSSNHHQHKLVKELGSFDSYIHWRCVNDVKLQKDFVCSPNGELLVNFIGRFERLESDFRQICSQIGVKAGLPKLNVSNTVPYKKYYNEETVELVRATFKDDIEMFRYEF